MLSATLPAMQGEGHRSNWRSWLRTEERLAPPWTNKKNTPTAFVMLFLLRFCDAVQGHAWLSFESTKVVRGWPHSTFCFYEQHWRLFSGAAWLSATALLSLPLQCCKTRVVGKPLACSFSSREPYKDQVRILAERSRWLRINPWNLWCIDLATSLLGALFYPAKNKFWDVPVRLLFPRANVYRNYFVQCE